MSKEKKEESLFTVTVKDEDEIQIEIRNKNGKEIAEDICNVLYELVKNEVLDLPVLFGIPLAVLHELEKDEEGEE